MGGGQPLGIVLAVGSAAVSALYLFAGSRVSSQAGGVLLA